MSPDPRTPREIADRIALQGPWWHNGDPLFDELADAIEAAIVSACTAQRATDAVWPGDLAQALIELQSASWSRSWKRVQAARTRVHSLTGLDVTGPLVSKRATAQAIEREGA